VLRRWDRGGLRVSVSAQRRCEPPDAAAVWQDFHGQLLGFIARRVPDRDSAEDILQEVMLSIHRHAADLEHPPAVAAWVHQIARNAIADYYRRAAVRREQPSGIDLDAREQQLPEAASADLRSELAACLRPLLQQLPEPYREAIMLTELEGLTQASAAARLGLSTSGMKSRVQRGRAQLKELLVGCCEIELDSRGAITSYEPRHDSCDCRSTPCGCRSTPPRLPE
jgi:RNA polymerase sigma-70 factor (ECF subfamily)